MGASTHTTEPLLLRGNSDDNVVGMSAYNRINCLLRHGGPSSKPLPKLLSTACDHDDEIYGFTPLNNSRNPIVCSELSTFQGGSGNAKPMSLPPPPPPLPLPTASTSSILSSSLINSDKYATNPIYSFYHDATANSNHMSAGNANESLLSSRNFFTPANTTNETTSLSLKLTTSKKPNSLLTEV